MSLAAADHTTVEGQVGIIRPHVILENVYKGVGPFR